MTNERAAAESERIEMLRRGAAGAAKAAAVVGDEGWAVGLIAAMLADSLARAEAGEMTATELTEAAEAACAFIEENSRA